MPPKKIYTRTGDKGKTSLYSGERVFKNHLRINAYGTIDELNSLLGVVISKLDDKRVEEFVNIVQKDLFEIGSYLAGFSTQLKGILKRVEEMEQIIDSLDEKLPSLANFVLPEGSEASCFLYFSRAVARRAERELVALSKEEEVSEKVLVYFNRLSDFLFTIARFLNNKVGFSETVWKKIEK